MTERNEKQDGQDAKAHAVAIYLWLLPLCVGLAIGVGIGAAMDRIGAGVAVGLFFVRRVRSGSRSS